MEKKNNGFIEILRNELGSDNRVLFQQFVTITFLSISPFPRIDTAQGTGGIDKHSVRFGLVSKGWV